MKMLTVSLLYKTQLIFSDLQSAKLTPHVYLISIYELLFHSLLTN